jgi:hypothetical protein
MSRYPMEKARAFGLALLPALVLAACGNSPEGAGQTDTGDATAEPQVAATPASIDPCTLVTSAEAAAALGLAEVKTGRPASVNNPPSLVTCLYTPASGEAMSVLNVMLHREASASEANSRFDFMKGSFADMGGAVDVAGPGEKAVWLPGGKQLWVLKGADLLGVSGDVPQEKAVELATTALTRLP